MKIICQKCAAGYSIDDRFVTPKGVRAQCPKCKHLQLVKKDDAPQGAAAPQATAMFAGGTAPPPAPKQMRPQDTMMSASSPKPQSNDDFLFDIDSPPTTKAPSPNMTAMFAGSNALAAPPQVAPVAPPPRSTSPMGAPTQASNVDELDFGELNSVINDKAPSAPKPAASQPSAPSLELDAPTPRNMTSGAAADPFASVDLAGLNAIPPPAASPAPSANSDASADGLKTNCSSCQKPLTDAFDQALGVCDECRNKPSSLEINMPDAGGSSSAPAAEPSSEDFSMLSNGESGEGTGLPSEEAPVDNSSGLETETERKPEAPKRSRPSSAPRPSAPIERLPGARSGVSRKKIAVISGAVVVALALVGVGYAERGNSRTAATGVKGFFANLFTRQKSAPMTPQVSLKNSVNERPIDNEISKWKKKFPELKGKSVEYMIAGEERLSKDTQVAYKEAEEAFQKAAVLDPENDRAIAGWVLALSFGRNEVIDEARANQISRVLRSAKARSNDARVSAAYAHFLLARGITTDVLVLASDALASPSAQDKALGHLAIGLYHLEKNVKEADQSLNEAEKLDPNLKRTYVVHAQQRIMEGKYKAATEGLELRVKNDVSHWESALMLARLYLDGGDVALAHQLFDRVIQGNSDNAEAQLGLAKLLYQHESKPKEALQQLETLLKRDGLSPLIKVRALGHVATIYRMAQKPEEAMKAINAALELDAVHPNVLAQRALLTLDANDAAKAREHVDALKGKTGIETLEWLFEGRALILEKKPADALENFQKVIQKDTRISDARFLAAHAALEAKSMPHVWQFALKNSVNSDPLQFGLQSPLQDIFIEPGAQLKAVRRAFDKMEGDPDDPNKAHAEALLAYQSMDFDAADRFLAKVLSIESLNGPSYALRAIIALRKKEISAAKKLAEKAVAADRQAPTAHLALGMVRLVEGHPDTARESLQAGLKLAPEMLALQSKLAESEAAIHKGSQQARDMLTRILAIDPLYAEARRVLYTMPK